VVRLVNQPAYRNLSPEQAIAKLPADDGVVEFGAVEGYAGLGQELREARAVARFT